MHSNVTERNATVNLTPREVRVIATALAYLRTNAVLLESTHDLVPIPDLTVGERRLPFPTREELDVMIERFRKAGRPRKIE